MLMEPMDFSALYMQYRETDRDCALLHYRGEEIISILNLADQLKYENKHHIPHPLLAGKTLGMIFEKASTRTRVSFEVGMNQLGGTPLFLSSADS